MRKYFVYVEPKAGEPFRFVVGLKRHWLFWRKPVYSYRPLYARVDDYGALDRLPVRASLETDRMVMTVEARKFLEANERHMFYAVREKDKERWYTGRWYAEAAGGVKRPEASIDFYDCQLFVRKDYALELLSLVNRAGYSGIVEPVFVNLDNVFRAPSIITVCVNRVTGAVHYLKSCSGESATYTDSLSEALLLFPEESERVYELLCCNHKRMSFTMFVKPDRDIPASKIRECGNELKQGLEGAFSLRKYGKEKGTC